MTLYINHHSSLIMKNWLFISLIQLWFFENAGVFFSAIKRGKSVVEVPQIPGKAWIKDEHDLLTFSQPWFPSFLALVDIKSVIHPSQLTLTGNIWLHWREIKAQRLWHKKIASAVWDKTSQTVNIWLDVNGWCKTSFYVNLSVSDELGVQPS